MSKTKNSLLIFCECFFDFRAEKSQFLHLRYSVAVMGKKEFILEVECYRYIFETEVSFTTEGEVCTFGALKSG